MSPHFSNPTLTWLMVLLLLLIALQLVVSAYFRQNQAALIIGVGTLFMAMGYAVALAPLYIYPGDLVRLGWFSNVVAEMVWYVGYASYGLVIITTQWRKVPGAWAVGMLVLGLAVVMVSAYFYQPPLLLANGSYDFRRLLIADFVPFIYGLLLAFGLGRFFLSAYRRDMGYRWMAILVALGTLLVAIPQPLSTVLTSVDVKFYFQITSIVGLLLILLGLMLRREKDG